MTALPSALSLTNIADGAPIVASDHRNNYSALQTDFNEVLAILSAGTAGQVLTSNGGADIAFAAGRTVYFKTTEKDVVSTTAETDLLNGEITIAGGKINTAGAVWCHLQGDYLDNVGNTMTLKFKFGGTTWWQGTVGTGAAATRHAWQLDMFIQNLGVANAQDAHAIFNLSLATAPTTGIGVIGTTNNTGILAATKGALTVDTTSAATVAVTCAHSQNSASVSMRLESAFVRVI
jgi:hypothetical protein